MMVAELLEEKLCHHLWPGRGVVFRGRCEDRDAVSLLVPTATYPRAVYVPVRMPIDRAAYLRSIAVAVERVLREPTPLVRASFPLAFERGNGTIPWHPLGLPDFGVIRLQHRCLGCA